MTNNSPPSTLNSPLSILNSKLLLCVEDDLKILANNLSELTSAGYRVLGAENLAQAREHLAAEKPDAILLDIMLPNGNGLDLLQELRSVGNKVPVIMLTAWGEPKDVSRGYRLGATAYLSKPFDYDAVEAAIESIFGHLEQVPESVSKGSLTFDILSGRAFIEGVDMLLTPKDFALLLLLAQNEDRVLRAELIYEKVWKAPLAENTAAVQRAISRLRGKIEPSGYSVTMTRGKGYVFERV
ncbi:DNA-binding response regulator [Synergistales bacterium]|nr:DNA-binding response regulator [Synergistales bacterium]